MDSDASSIRPTKNVVVRALCDILRPVIAGTEVLELFAGTGRVGEALLEEGADRVLGVDEREAPEDLPEEYEWIRRDVPSFVKGSFVETFDVIFMDPPYASDYAEDLLPEIAESGLLREQGIVAVETGYDTELPEEQPGANPLQLMRKREYGGTRLWIYQSDRDQPGYQEEG
jgi:16S rRNA (guanine966-N2)-methyltransferase